ncbi:hypothetical protein C8F04DRAFT_1193808 [Mycena alexandri]|uniref:Uncharacterized protein n=1 Tax=Mycena alexandri TaxID=1745969 RepID=A0AAD6S9T6_9AGAR|nr:hypothetical protein C8F04DRAFT_1193808 [Mycena alexandri]
MTTIFPALQAKVTMFFFWATNKCTFVSANKSKWMIFGPLPGVIPVLRIRDLIVELVHEFKYVGIWYTSVHANRPRLGVRLTRVFALKHRIGTLPVKEGILMYTARVDCYLISGCELSLDTAGGLIEEHIDVQHTFLRRLLRLNSHSMLAILFTETGQMPLRIRRLLLALGRLRYMVEVGPGRVVHDTFLDSIALLHEGKPGWASDLVIMLSRLPTPILVDADDLLSVDSINSIQKKVVAIVDADLQRDINNLVKTHLLRNCLEMGENKSLVLVTRHMRHYLTMVVVPAHRKALTGLLLGDHPLSVERLRYATRYRDTVPHYLRLCHFCRGAVEDKTHALFDCVQNGRLQGVREQFTQSLAVCDPNLYAYHTQIPNYDFLLQLISLRKAVKVLAKFVFNVLTLFQKVPWYSPIVLRHP